MQRHAAFWFGSQGSYTTVCPRNWDAGNAVSVNLPQYQREMFFVARDRPVRADRFIQHAAFAILHAGIYGKLGDLTERYCVNWHPTQLATKSCDGNSQR